MLEKYLLSNDKYSILNRKYSPEMSITLFYLLTFGEYDMNYFINNYNNKEIVFSLMKKYFDVVDVNELSPLHISNNQVNKSFTKGFNDNNSIKTINDLI